MSEKRALDRRALLRAIAGEIGFADQPAVCRHVLGDAIGDPPGVERVRPIGRDRLQRRRQIRLNEPIAGSPMCRRQVCHTRRPRRESAAWARPHGASPLSPRASDPAIAKALRRELGGRHDDVLPGELAELLMRERHAAHGARHARGEIPGRVRRPSIFPSWPDIHRRRRLSRRDLAIVERRRPPVGRAHDHEAAAAEIAGGWDTSPPSQTRWRPRRQPHCRPRARTSAPRSDAMSDDDTTRPVFEATPRSVGHGLKRPRGRHEQGGGERGGDGKVFAHGRFSGERLTQRAVRVRGAG